MREIVQRFAVLALLLATPAVGVAQTPETAPPAVVESAETADQDATAAFPVRDTAPRLQRAYLHVFLAFGVAWLLILAYAMTLGSRFSRLEKDLERFKRS